MISPLRPASNLKLATPQMQPYGTLIGVEPQLKRDGGATFLFQGDPLYNPRRRKLRAGYSQSEPVIEFLLLDDSTV
jgi:hypothetical protein